MKMRQLYLEVEETDFGTLVSSILKELAIVYLDISDADDFEKEKENIEWVYV